MKIRSRAVVLLMLALALTGAALAAKKFTMPRAYHAKTYPARDEHTQEQVTVAADPYDTADRQEIFSVDYREHGVLPVLLIVTNDSDHPISLVDMKVEMMTSQRVKLPEASMDDVIRRIQREVKRPDAPRTYPLPIPRRKPKPNVDQATRDEIDESMFHAHAVEAHSTQSGFVYFDVSGISNPLAGARLSCSGLKNEGQELFFFEIAMEKYLTYQPGKTP